MGMEINIDRLMTNLFEMAKIGMNEKGGIDRALGSQADYETRQWLLSYWEKNFKLHPFVDPIANMWVKRKGREPLLPIVIGSHHDAVPDGGKYDGAMGVLIATEIMQRIVEDDIPLRHPVWIISFTGEEPNPFNLSTLGSKVISGRLKKEDLVNCKNRETGESLKDAIAKLGGNFERLDEARIEKGTIAAFLEPHNELGRHLEAEDLSVGSVSCITGIYREEITVLGEANHAGTTMMQDRKDALLALSEIALEIEEAAIEFENPDVVATMGYVKIIPNEASIIPGQAKAIIDIRTCERNIQDQILEKIYFLTCFAPGLSIDESYEALFKPEWKEEWKGKLSQAETDANQAASVRNLRALWKQDPEGQLEKAKKLISKWKSEYRKQEA